MTVHRALAGKPDVAAKTRARVLEEAERLGYRPNIAARGLRQGKTFTLGVLLSDVAASFLPEVLQGIHLAAEDRGYHAIVCVHEHDPDRAKRHLQHLQSKGVDGIVYYPTLGGKDLDVLNQVARNTPTVAIMREAPGFTGSTVLVDDRLGGAVAVRHLLELGHQRVGFLGYEDNGFTQERQQGYEETLREAGIEPRPEWIAHASRREDACRAATGLLTLPERPTALFCASDRLAARAIQAAAALELNVPRNLSVVGFNGDAWLDLLSVPLTTVAQPRLELGSRAARLVLEPLEDAGGHAVIKLDPWLVARESTALLSP
ncbi:MAG: LacI family transcriptional regulator [Armatimonadetes bacterium]|nr:LacI family transcriptional regulator [Armatimonadota bacterium]